jgi:ubiquinone/menaquinone biosynthesis C-methylase UbiE
MNRDRDVAAFEKRAPGYEDGWLGRMHREIADRTLDLALRCVPEPGHVLDVGCGTGYLLRRLAVLVPTAVEIAGIDAAPEMIRVAEAASTDDRVRFSTGVAEGLPYGDQRFDLILSTTSFDHWPNQRAGLTECFRVLRPGGHLVLCDQFSAWMHPTLLGARRGKARSKRRATRVLTSAGFGRPQWHKVYAVLIRAATSTKDATKEGAEE